MTSYCDVTISVYPVTMNTIRHCSIQEFGRGHTIKQSPQAWPVLCTPLTMTDHKRHCYFGKFHPEWYITENQSVTTNNITMCLLIRRSTAALFAFLWRESRLLLLVVICFDFNFLQTTAKCINREAPIGIFIKKDRKNRCQTYEICKICVWWYNWPWRYQIVRLCRLKIWFQAARYDFNSCLSWTLLRGRRQSNDRGSLWQEFRNFLLNVLGTHPYSHFLVCEI